MTAACGTRYTWNRIFTCKDTSDLNLFENGPILAQSVQEINRAENIYLVVVVSQSEFVHKFAEGCADLECTAVMDLFSAIP